MTALFPEAIDLMAVYADWFQVLNKLKYIVLSWKVPYALVTSPLTSLPAGMLLFTSILRRIHTQLPHTIPHNFCTGPRVHTS